MACAGSNKPFALLLLALSFFCFSNATAAVNGGSAPALEARQSPSATGGVISPACQDYAIAANYSTIGQNSTLRAAFLRSVSMGTNAAVATLDSQTLRLPSLLGNNALNQECGNLVRVAIAGAAANFTQGQVAGLPIKAALGADPAGPVTPLVVILCLIVFGTTFMSM
jgi:hypothetical protein